MTASPQISCSSNRATLLDYSVFSYCYRDASNYKSWGQLLLRGRAFKSDEERLRAVFDSGEYFIAEQLNILPLYAALWELSGGPTVDDHVWHTFHELRPAAPEETNAPVFDAIEELVSKACAIRSWDETLSPHWHL